MLTATKLMKKADPIQAHMDALDEAQAALPAAEKELSSLLDLFEAGGFTPDIRTRVALRTSERDASRGRVAQLEGKKPVSAEPINLMQLKTQEDRQRARVELARLIERVEVVGDMEEIQIRSMWFKPVVLTPDGIPVGVEIKSRKGKTI